MKRVLFLVWLVLTACEPDAAGPLTPDLLLDPESCKGCHERTHTEWAASMHAYAVDDPVFRAMNAQAQDAGLGDFCVSCHAPMAVRTGAFANGDFNDFDQVPDHLEGVTCFFCHTVVDIERDHNNGLVLASEDDEPINDDILWGGIAEPVQPYAHRAAASKYFDRNRPTSSQMCGSCHDIVVPGTGTDFHLERTYEEYLSSIYTQAGPGGMACIDCHMDGSRKLEAVARYDGVPLRPRHSHLFPGVDVPLTPFPGREAMVSAVERYMLQKTIGAFAVSGAVTPEGFTFTVSIDQTAAHKLPSGAAQDRRMWLEWIASDAAGVMIDESGTIDEDEVEVGHDPRLWLMRDVLFDEDGKETHVFWEARTRDDADLIPVATTDDPGAHTLFRSFTLDRDQPPARIVFRLRLRPIGLDVLHELVDAGDLDPAIVQEMPTFTVHEATAEWPDPEAPEDVIVREVDRFDGTDHLCKLFPADSYCRD